MHCSQNLPIQRHFYILGKKTFCIRRVCKHANGRNKSFFKIKEENSGFILSAYNHGTQAKKIEKSSLMNSVNYIWPETETLVHRCLPIGTKIHEYPQKLSIL